MSLKIRDARIEDAKALLEIYRPHVEDSAVSFETELPSIEEFAGRIETLLHQYPYLIAEEGGCIAGYAYASPHRSRRAYDWTAECTVYIHKDFHRRGVGRKLYERLFQILREQGYASVLAGVTLPNAGSEGLHLAMGFRDAGVYKRAGYKLGRWHDVGWFQLLLNPEGPVRPPIPYRELNGKV